MIFGPRNRTAADKLALARALQSAGQRADAVQAYNDALELGALEIEAHFQLAILYLQRQEHPRALDHLQKALAIEPENGDVLCLLGAVLHDVGRPVEALQFCQRAAAARPDSAEAHYQLALARFEQSDLKGAGESFAKCFVLRRGEPWGADPAGALAQPATPQFAPVEMAANRVKIAHDCEQFEYLLSNGRLPAAFREVAADYRALLAELGDSSEAVMRGFDPLRHPLVARSYKRPVHIDPGAAPAGTLLNPALDSQAIEARYLESKPSIAIADDLLTSEGLDALRRFCRESTLWNEIKPGYLGAYLHDGFAARLLLRLAAEIRARLPRIIRGLPLQTLWGYKYDSTLPRVGIGWHADAAAVNVNLWITADDANLDPDHGGLLIYPEYAPEDWSFAEFNTDTEAILDHLETSGGVPIRVPYRANRAVIFDSDLFHATDGPSFRDGYIDRRVNVTFLFGVHGA